MLLTILIVLLVLWLIGGIVAIILMWYCNVHILCHYALPNSYTKKEFVLGFFASWVTVCMVRHVITDNL